MSELLFSTSSWRFHVRLVAAVAENGLYFGSRVSVGSAEVTAPSGDMV